MRKKRLKPDDPAVLEAVLRRIDAMTREERLERLRRRPDFDESWVTPQKGERAADGAEPGVAKVPARIG